MFLITVDLNVQYFWISEVPYFGGVEEKQCIFKWTKVGFLNVQCLE